MKQIKLNKEDLNVLLELLQNPPEPNENLKALMQGKPLPITTPSHVYKENTTSGIGFCEICYSDNANDGNHIL